ncbi:glycosyltransferase family 61 protein [Paenibacillus typhae]|uniref:glycosyltransferase family 61 protein n=1 Tax=Paenibacillus typhae TaxID=1174501 RepID=UPI00289AC1C0|nr:glycosyltransferase family 61 protein [Paenibacillus typhae]MBY0011894.1 glycosyltransferase family 61 protein [Paenibacillus typhae]
MEEVSGKANPADTNLCASGFYQDVWEWEASASSGDEIRLGSFDFGETAEYVAPKTVETEVHPYLNSYTLQPEGGYIAYIPNGRVWGPSGSILTSEDKLIYDLSPEYDGQLNRMLTVEEHPALHRQKAREHYNLKGTAAALTFCGSPNYFHWLYDVLPRLGMLRIQNIPFQTLIMNPNPYGTFVQETLTMFGIAESSIIRTGDDKEIQAELLVAPSLMMNSHYPPWATSTLRKFMLPGRDTTLRSPGRIFISRSKVSSRRIINENEVIRCLESYGFVPVRMEDWTVAQQIQLFASAEAIVSPHGAGLSNLAFCMKGTVVVEIFHRRHVVPTYWMISNHNKLDYYMMYGQADETLQDRFSGFADFSVDLDLLKQTLGLTGLSKQNV